jgi:hypothetical protein
MRIPAGGRPSCVVERDQHASALAGMDIVSQNEAERIMLENDKREQARQVAQQETKIREFKVAQRLRCLWLVVSLTVAGLLGWATVVGLLESYPMPFSYVGLVAGLTSTAIAIWKVLENRPVQAQMEHELAVKQTDQLRLVAASETDHRSALRIYRAGSKQDIEKYRRLAGRNRRTHNLFQGMIIIGSIVVTAVGSAGPENPWFRWTGVVTAALVSVSAGFTGYFKYRERGFNEQQTGDAIEKEFKAVELKIGEYDTDEETALKIYARKVEALKEEQRKRELQLEQSPGQHERGSS